MYFEKNVRNRSRVNMLNFGHFLSLRARQSRAWQSLCCENLRLLRPLGRSNDTERRFAPVNGYECANTIFINYFG